MAANYLGIDEEVWSDLQAMRLVWNRHYGERRTLVQMQEIVLREGLDQLSKKLRVRSGSNGNECGGAQNSDNQD